MPINSWTLPLPFRKGPSLPPAPPPHLEPQLREGFQRQALARDQLEQQLERLTNVVHQQDSYKRTAKQTRESWTDYYKAHDAKRKSDQVELHGNKAAQFDWSAQDKANQHGLPSALAKILDKLDDRPSSSLTTHTTESHSKEAQMKRSRDDRLKIGPLAEEAIEGFDAEMEMHRDMTQDARKNRYTEQRFKRNRVKWAILERPIEPKLSPLAQMKQSNTQKVELAILQRPSNEPKFAPSAPTKGQNAQKVKSHGVVTSQGLFGLMPAGLQAPKQQYQ